MSISEGKKREMAGSLALVASKHAEKLATTIKEGWEVEFSRFFSYPPLDSTCPDLGPLPPYIRNRRPFGNWITSMSSAWLQLLHGRSSSGVILTVFLSGKIQEEHYVSKLHFSWPQASCISGFPARGTRAVIVSYRDCVGEVQKFALRFSTICETETFLKALKDILKGASDIEPHSSEFGSVISSQSDFIPSNRPLYRATEEMRVMTPVLAYTPELLVRSNIEAAQHSYIQETTPTHNNESNFAANLPPSFTALLTGCGLNVEQAAANPTVPEENDLKLQVTKLIGDASFHDLLFKMEKIMDDLGGDLTL